MVLVDFGDGTDDFIDVENILSVEVPFDDDRCNVLFKSRDNKKIWGYMDKHEAWKIARHRDVVIGSCYLECLARDTLRKTLAGK